MNDRLSQVNDVCHILANPHHAWRSGSWHRAGLPPDTANLPNGYTDVVVNNRLLLWRRHYTRDGEAPVLEEKEIRGSFLSIDEWAPGIWPLASVKQGWQRMGNSSHHGIAYLPTDGNFLAQWSTQAKRHLKTFQKAGCKLRLGTFADVEGDILHSQVPRAMGMALAKITKYRLDITPESVDILVAENAEGKRIGCFVAGNDDALRESMYVLGYFVPEAAKLHPMVGLVHWWFMRSVERGYQACNFGLMCGPYTSRWDPWWGLSNFKTHFGITRVHLPPGFWKVRWNGWKKEQIHTDHNACCRCTKYKIPRRPF